MIILKVKKRFKKEMVKFLHMEAIGRQDADINCHESSDLKSSFVNRQIQNTSIEFCNRY
jgi:hypothetical protein